MRLVFKELYNIIRVFFRNPLRRKSVLSRTRLRESRHHHQRTAGIFPSWVHRNLRHRLFLLLKISRLSTHLKRRRKQPRHLRLFQQTTYRRSLPSNIVPATCLSGAELPLRRNWSLSLSSIQTLPASLRSHLFQAALHSFPLLEITSFPTVLHLCLLQTCFPVQSLTYETHNRSHLRQDSNSMTTVRRIAGAAWNQQQVDHSSEFNGSRNNNLIAIFQIRLPGDGYSNIPKADPWKRGIEPRT